MEKNKILFLILSFSNFAVLPLLGMSDLEDGIINSDVEKVKNALGSISLTEYNKIGLIDLANDIIFKRLKEIEHLRFGNPSNIKEYQEAINKPLKIMASGFSGLLLTAVLTMIVIEEENKFVGLAAVLAGMFSAGTLIGGLVLLVNRVEAFNETINQAFTDAAKIKKLIHDKGCMA